MLRHISANKFVQHDYGGVIAHTPETADRNIRIVKEMFTSNDVQTKQLDTFANAIWPVLAIAQFFGLMPVDGISSPQPSSIVFRWRSLRVLCTGFYLAVSAATAVLYLKHISKEGINAKNVVGLVFFSFCCFCGLLFLFLAQRWAKLCSVWFQQEAVFLLEPYDQTPPGVWRLSTKIRMMATLFFTLALLEHLLFYVSNLYDYYVEIGNCGWPVGKLIRTWMFKHYTHIFAVIPFSVWMATVLIYANFIFTFAWNYMDIFIMLISIGLATRFQQINQRLANAAGGALNDAVPLLRLSPELCLEIRRHHVRLCELLETVDVNLAPIILLSCANNLYFICVQLLNIFNSLPHLLNEIYFWYSLLYLIGRTAYVFLCAAGIHDASRRPLAYIRLVRTSGWSTELERFTDQIGSEQIALSGMRFFYLTRKLLFGMAGTIVTYELVLLQIDASSKKAAAAAEAAASTVTATVVDACWMGY